MLSQSFQNFEVIIVNDGSTDNGEEIVRNIKNDKVKLVTQTNSGVSAARNKGAEKAQYGFLAFLDGDDTWEENFLEEMNCLVEEFPKAGIYGTNNTFIYNNNKIMPAGNFDALFSGKTTGIIENYFAVFASIKRSPFSNSNLCIPKKIFSEFGGYKLGVRLTEDSDLWCRIAMKYEVAYNVKPLANYYLETIGNTHGIFEPTPFQVTVRLIEALKGQDVKTQHRNSVKKLISLQQLYLVKRALVNREKAFACRIMKDVNLLKHYPKDYIICCGMLLLPNQLGKILIKTKNKLKG